MPTTNLLRALAVAVAVIGAATLAGCAPDASPEPSGSTSTTISETPSTGASESPSVTPPPTEQPSAGLVITGFTPANNTPAGCEDTTGATPVVFAWTSTGATKAYFGVQTENAKQQPYESNLDPNGSITVDYQCSLGSQIYTVTVESASGATVSKTVTLTN